jgi:hypothetical protein
MRETHMYLSVNISGTNINWILTDGIIDFETYVKSHCQKNMLIPFQNRLFFKEVGLHTDVETIFH